MSTLSLPRALPTEVGVSPEALLRLLDRLDHDPSLADYPHDLHGLMLLRHGRVFAEGHWAPYSPAAPHELYSLSKSFTSTAIGFAVQEGLLRLDDKLVRFFAEKLPARPCEYMEELTLYDLLTMNTGHTVEPDIFAAPDPTAAFLQSYIAKKPGTHFLYNTAGTYMLSAVLQRVTGATVEEYLTPRLFEPLGIKRHAWDQTPQGVSCGGFGLNLTTDSVARFGQFLLQRGVWEGKHLLNAEWIDLATSRRVNNAPNPQADWEQGYGFQFWRCLPEGVYRGDGAFGQFCIVSPAHELVIAVTAGNNTGAEILRIFWEDLLPSLSAEALPADPEGQAELEARLSSLTLPTPAGTTFSPVAEQFCGTEYILSPNPYGWTHIGFDFGEEADLIRFRTADGEFLCNPGHGCWREGGSGGTGPAACTAAWTGNAYHLRIAHTATPYLDDLEINFDERGIDIHVQRNVAMFGHPTDTHIFGR